MKILVVGNGFDLAHSLPTSYWNCLYFLYICYHCHCDHNFSYWRSVLWRDPNRADRKTKDFTYSQMEFLKEHLCLFCKDTMGFNSEIEHEELHYLLDECITDNVWLDYFWILQEDHQIKGYKWIDFEAEMTKVVQKIDSLMTAADNSVLSLNDFEPRFFKDADLKRDANLSVVGRRLFSIVQENIKVNSTLKELQLSIVDYLYDNLLKLTTAVEIYFKTCIPQQKRTLWPLECLRKLGNMDKVISFNYTSTFVSYMKNPEESNICHIHGKIRDSISDYNSPLVLGIDEYLDVDSRDKNVDWAILKKYFQRIYKHSDFKYKGWEIFNSPNRSHSQGEIDLYIFGHSLDITDRDVLYDLISNGRQSTTTIFYRNATQLAGELKNLIRLIGSEELNNRTRSIPPSIVFVKQ